MTHRQLPIPQLLYCTRTYVLMSRGKIKSSSVYNRTELLFESEVRNNERVYRFILLATDFLSEFWYYL